MARIPEDEIERLKREVSLERLAKAAGIELRRHGADLPGRASVVLAACCVERVIGTIRRECLDHMIVFGEPSLPRNLRSYFHYYHGSKTHLSRAGTHRIPGPCIPCNWEASLPFPELAGCITDRNAAPPELRTGAYSPAGIGVSRRWPDSAGQAAKRSKPLCRWPERQITFAAQSGLVCRLRPGSR